MVCSYSRTPLFLRKWYSQNEEGILNRVFCLSVVHEANEAARVSFSVSARRQNISFRVLHATLNVFFSKMKCRGHDGCFFLSYILSVGALNTNTVCRASQQRGDLSVGAFSSVSSFLFFSRVFFCSTTTHKR